MDEEMQRRIYYTRAVNKLYSISRQLSKLDNLASTIKSKAEQTIQVDNKIIAEKDFNESKNQINKAKSNIQRAIGTANSYR